MTAALWLLLGQGLLGAFDTAYYHEYRARLPAGGVRARPELLLHAARDLVYAVLFATLPFFDWRGALAAVLALLILAEIALTMADFVVEVRVRAPVGVLPGERVTHGLMAIAYGAALACLVPEMLAWSREPTALAAAARDVPGALTWTLLAMGIGVFLSGVRDAAAALGLPGSSYPWPSHS
jgi:hypothetical protein